MSRPIQGGDGERCGLRSAKWTSTLGPSAVQLYVADSVRRCDPDEVSAGGFHVIGAVSRPGALPAAGGVRDRAMFSRRRTVLSTKRA
jgi:hypothetical protein